MARLVAATADQIDRIARESHPLWGAGLSLTAYRAMWDDLADSRWGRAHAAFLVWSDERGRMLSSMKTYRPRLLLAGREARGLVLGAIFTPARQRGRGHARAMVQAALERAAAQGVPAALLFSDIGSRYYAELGFHPLAAEEQWGRLPAAGAAAANGELRLRDARASDLPAIHAAHDAFCRRQPVALLRDRDHWDYLELRARSFFTRLGRSDLTQHLRVAVEGEGFVGYLLTVEGRGEWNVREVGSRAGDPGRIGALVRLGAAEAAARGLRRFYAWWPADVCEQLGDWSMQRQRRQRAIPMLRPLGEAADHIAPRALAGAYLPFQDQF